MFEREFHIANLAALCPSNAIPQRASLDPSAQ